MANSVEIKAQLHKGPNSVLSKAFAECSNHFSVREKDSYFVTADGVRFKVKHQENIMDGRHVTCVISYQKVSEDGITFTTSKMEFCEQGQNFDCLEKSHAEHIYQGRIVKVRDTFLLQRNGFTVSIAVDKLQVFGDFFEIKIALHENSDLVDAKWLAKRLCFEFDISPRDVFAAPLSYQEMLSSLDVYMQKKAFREEQQEKLNRMKREQAMQETLEKYNQWNKWRNANLQRLKQRRKQWRQNQAAARWRRLIREKGVKASEALKQARRLNRATDALKAIIKKESEVKQSVECFTKKTNLTVDGVTVADKRNSFTFHKRNSSVMIEMEIENNCNVETQL